MFTKDDNFRGNGGEIWPGHGMRCGTNTYT